MDMDSSAASRTSSSCSIRSTLPTKDGKPKRPLTAYNMFFQQERKKILAATPTRTEGKPIRSHGKIGFAELARTVAGRWKQVSEQDKKHFNVLAVAERERYTRELEDWNARKKAILQECEGTIYYQNSTATTVVAPAGQHFQGEYQHSKNNNTDPRYLQSATLSRRMSAPASFTTMDFTSSHGSHWGGGYSGYDPSTQSPYNPSTRSPDNVKTYGAAAEETPIPMCGLPPDLEKIYQHQVQQFCRNERRRLLSSYIDLERQTSDYLTGPIECLPCEVSLLSNTVTQHDDDDDLSPQNEEVEDSKYLRQFQDFLSDKPSEAAGSTLAQHDFFDSPLLEDGNFGLDGAWPNNNEEI